MDNSKAKSKSFVNNYTVYVISSKGERTFWTKVGIASTNIDGSINVKLDSLPMGGELHLRPLIE